MREVTRELRLDHRYLHLPVKTGAPKRRMSVVVDREVVREFEIELADDPGWWAHLDVSPWRGKTAVLRVDGLPGDSSALRSVVQADEIWAADRVYREPLRAQIHFSPRRGWNNDPNGLVYSQGEYHLYFQHNPYGWSWGNMHWGHAVSRDLVHWDEQPIALYPRRFGDWAFSGSAVVDEANSSGWRRGGDPLLVAAYTSTGRGECIVHSNDRGRTWNEFEGNPVVRHQGRDPRLLWHEPTRRWVMAVYDESDGKRWIAFHTSPDLKTWTYRSRIEGFFECPDLFELAVAGDAGRRRWVLTAASSEYMVGTFDGATFRPETPKLPGHRGRGFYAAQTFSHDPRGRVVQIGWLQTETPGMPFNQGMSLPLDLSLRTTPDGPRLAWQPVQELRALRSRTILRSSGTVRPGDNPLAGAGRAAGAPRGLRAGAGEPADPQGAGRGDRPRCGEARDPRRRPGGAGAARRRQAAARRVRGPHEPGDLRQRRADVLTRADQSRPAGHESRGTCRRRADRVRFPRGPRAEPHLAGGRRTFDSAQTMRERAVRGSGKQRDGRHCIGAGRPISSSGKVGLRRRSFLRDWLPR